MRANVINRTRKTSLGMVKFADTFISRFRGLMLRRDIDDGLVLEIPPGRGRYGSGIHMFFMRVPLDVLFLDEDMVVLETVQLEPWQYYNPRKPARYVVELRRGVLEKSGTLAGDLIEFIPV